MAITTTWGVNALDSDIATGKVNTVHWCVNAVDTVLDPEGEPYRAYAYGGEDFDGPVTVPYSSLTPEICIGWVQDAMGPEQVAAVEQGVVSRIARQKNPVTEAGVPW